MQILVLINTLLNDNYLTTFKSSKISRSKTEVKSRKTLGFCKIIKNINKTKNKKNLLKKINYEH